MRPSLRWFIPTVALAAVVAGCNGDRPSPDRAASTRPARQSLRGTPLMPGSAPVTSTVGSDAADIVFNVPFQQDSVANWYRTRLIADGWDLQGDGKLSDGTVSLHATRNGPPLWILVRSTGVKTSQVTMIGGVPDSGTVEDSGTTRR